MKGRMLRRLAVACAGFAIACTGCVSEALQNSDLAQELIRDWVQFGAEIGLFFVAN